MKKKLGFKKFLTLGLYSLISVTVIASGWKLAEYIDNNWQSKEANSTEPAIQTSVQK